MNNYASLFETVKSNDEIFHIPPAKKELRNLRLERIKAGVNDSIFVVVQTVQKTYGGPEEGGWWFNWYTTVECIEIDPNETPGYPVWKRVLYWARKMREEFDISPVSRDTYIKICYCEEDFPPETTGKPRWE